MTREKTVFNFLKPDLLLEEIQDDEQVKKKYKYWRFRTFYGMYIGYAFYYFTRKSFTFAIPSMLEEGFSFSELGMLGSILSITYGISKFASGIIGDKSNPRYFMSIGLILTGIFNIGFGLSSTWILLAIFWGLNAWFQGWGWPGCAKLLTHWYSQSERGRWWSVWNTSHNLGGAIIPIIIAFVAYHYGWRFSMLIPGFLAIAVGFFLMNRLRDIPQTLGLPPIEKFKKEDLSTVLNENKTGSLTAKQILFDYVLSNKYIWVMAFAYFFIYIIRIGFNDWAMVYFVANGYSKIKAAGVIVWFELGGFLGSLFAGWLSDKFFCGKRNPVSILFTLGAICSLVAMHWNGADPFFLNVTLVFLIGFFIFGPQMLIGMAAAELPDKKAAATSSGFAGCFAYFGAAMAGGPLGFIIAALGWNGFFLMLVTSGLIALALMVPLWSIKTSTRKQSNEIA
jgi:OPA family sugar phosphate sensor protein UhpC-like MFS transporter